MEILIIVNNYNTRSNKDLTDALEKNIKKYMSRSMRFTFKVVVSAEEKQKLASMGYKALPAMSVGKKKLYTAKSIIQELESIYLRNANNYDETDIIRQHQMGLLDKEDADEGSNFANNHQALLAAELKRRGGYVEKEALANQQEHPSDTSEVIKKSKYDREDNVEQSAKPSQPSYAAQPSKPSSQQSHIELNSEGGSNAMDDLMHDFLLDKAGGNSIY